MHTANEFKDPQIVEEGLKIIINLFRFKECGLLLDSYESESYPINILTQPEKTLLRSILKAEFT